MNNKFVNFLAFSCGAAIGSAVTWKILKTKYEQLAQEEIDSVKEVYSKKYTALTNEVEKAHKCAEANMRTQYTQMVADLGYETPASEEEVEGETVNKDGVYVISPDDFGELDYDIVSLVYYADEVLAYESGEVIENPDDIITRGSLKTFGEYEDDSVFVRNDLLRTDYEILLDTRDYHSVYKDE